MCVNHKHVHERSTGDEWHSDSEDTHWGHTLRTHTEDTHTLSEDTHTLRTHTDCLTVSEDTHTEDTHCLTVSEDTHWLSDLVFWWQDESETLRCSGELEIHWTNQTLILNFPDPSLWGGCGESLWWVVRVPEGGGLSVPLRNTQWASRCLCSGPALCTVKIEPYAFMTSESIGLYGAPAASWAQCRFKMSLSFTLGRNSYWTHDVWSLFHCPEPK